MAHLTEELRRLVDINGSIHIFRDELDKIADNIDKRHHDECQKSWDEGCEYGMNQPLLEIQNYIKLPLDADGNTLHVGDWTDIGRIVVLACREGNDWRVFTSNCADGTPPNLIRITEPTPKQILLDFYARMNGDIFDPTEDEDIINDTIAALNASFRVSAHMK